MKNQETTDLSPNQMARQPATLLTVHTATAPLKAAVLELIGIVDYLASIVERLAMQAPDDRDIPIAREIANRAGKLRVEMDV